jgi:DNA-binding SARP family transcriptional activator
VIERRDADHRPLLVAGDLLPDWYDDWVVYERERLRQLRLHALELRCGELSRQGRYAEATDAGLAAVAGDPLRETAQRALIAAYLAEGNPSDALRQYDLYRRTLAETLGLTPSPCMHALVASVHERS